MAVIFFDGFDEAEWNSHSALLYGWTVQVSGMTQPEMLPVSGGHALRLKTTNTSGTSRYCRLQRDITHNWGDWFGIGFRINHRVRRPNLTFATIFALAENGSTTRIVDLMVASNGLCHVNGEPSEANVIMEQNIENFLELELDKVAQEARVWLNNTLVGIAPLVGDEANLRVRIGVEGVDNFTNSTIVDIDDFYVADGTGTVNTRRLGKVKVVQRLPQSDLVAQFQRDSGDSNASQVSDTGAPSSDTTYVYSNEPGTTDLYTNSDPLPYEDAPVLAVGVAVIGRKEGADSHELVPIIQSGGAQEVGPRIALMAGSFRGGLGVFNTDPSTGEAWDANAAAQAAFGQQLVV